MTVRAAAMEVAGLRAADAEDAVLYQISPHFPSCSPSAQFQVPSLAHQGFHAVLHFTHHTHPSALGACPFLSSPQKEGGFSMQDSPFRAAAFPLEKH